MRLAALCLGALAVADALSAQPATGTKPKRVLVPIADGTEEIEVVTVVDVLRRAGAEVVLASVEDDDRTAVTCSRGVKIEADCHVKAVTGRQGGKEGWDLIAIPGGMPGAERIRETRCTIQLSWHFAKSFTHPTYCLICAQATA